MNKMKQAHFFSLPTQGNVYTIANLHLANKTNKLLIATLKRQVYCFEYVEDSMKTLVPTTKEISFTYIPSGAEIISIDAFNKSADKNDFVIGITIIKSSVDNSALETYLNIYSEWEESKDFNIESIAQNCLNVQLNFTPYQLTHATLVTWQDNKLMNKEIVIVLTGSDNKVHIFKENSNNHTYKEIDVKELFPEFINPPSVVLWLDIYYYKNNSERISVFGCECGYMRMVKVCCKTNAVLSTFWTRFVSTISQVKIFPEKKLIARPDFVAEHQTNLGSENDDSALSLIVINTVLPAMYFSDIVNEGLQKSITLRRTEMMSVSTCATIADIDFDGKQEILIGNSAEHIMAYKIQHEQDVAKLLEIKKLVSPIFNLRYLDLTGDGVKELVVFTMKGLYILQHEASHVQEILEENISAMTIPNLEGCKLSS